MSIENSVLKVVNVNGVYKLQNANGEFVPTSGVNLSTRRSAFKSGKAIKQVATPDGGFRFKTVPITEFESLSKPISVNNASTAVVTPVSEGDSTHTDIKDFIHNKSASLKPAHLVMPDLKWKYLIRSAMRGKNIMMTGASGCGKTLAAKSLVRSLLRPDFYFNLGSTQDARATLVGNTQFNKENGTFFAESAFVKAIKTPNAVILLDEISRAHPDAWNILMTVLDQGQRYLRLDEADGSPIVDVAEGVTFIATANIGAEYTSTRVIDRAILDRFTIIEMDLLDATQELDLLKFMYPECDADDLKAVAEIANHTREQIRSEAGKLSNMISTRVSVEMAGLLYDGFSLPEAAEIGIYPFFSPDGGVDSERTYMKQLVQKYIKVAKTPAGDEPEVEADDSDVTEIQW